MNDGIAHHGSGVAIAIEQYPVERARLRSTSRRRSTTELSKTESEKMEVQPIGIVRLEDGFPRLAGR
jgi:hypothetical protein